MSFRHSVLGFVLVLVLWGLPIRPLCAAPAEVPHSTRPVGPAEPTSAEVITNLHYLGKNPDGLRQLDEELNRSLQSFAPRGSLDGMFAPAITPLRMPVVVPRSRRTKEEMERQKNWMLMTPEEIMSGMQDNDSPKDSKAANPDKKKNALEQFYEDLDKRSNRSPKSDDPFGLHSKDKSQNDAQARDDDSNGPGSVKSQADALTKLLHSDQPEPNNPNAKRDRGVFGDLFGRPRDTGLSPEQELAHKTYMESYRKVLEPQPPAPTVNPLNPMLATVPGALAGPVTPQVYGGLGSFGSVAPHRDAFGFDGSGANGMLKTLALPDLNTTVLNQWNPLYTPPKLEAPKLAPLAVPVMESPRRRF